MDRLWAPWRAAYILGQSNPPEEDQGCIFCSKVARGPEHFAEELILVATADAFVMMNRYPYTNGHLLVAPRAHVASPDQLAPPARAALFELITDSIPALRRAMSPDGVNMGMNLGRSAGAGIADHCHMHLVPRWVGDNSFMSVVADTRVLSQSLEAAYAKLLPCFAPLAGGS
jgi:ATP adenylyltransferase